MAYYGVSYAPQHPTLHMHHGSSEEDTRSEEMTEEVEPGLDPNMWVQFERPDGVLIRGRYAPSPIIGRGIVNVEGVRHQLNDDQIDPVPWGTEVRVTMEDDPRDGTLVGLDFEHPSHYMVVLDGEEVSVPFTDVNIVPPEAAAGDVLGVLL